MKEIRETEISIKASQIKFEDSNNILSFESDIQEKEALKYLNRKPIENFSKMSPKKYHKTTIQIQKKLEKNKMYNFIFLLSTILVVKDFIDKLRNLSFFRSPLKLKKSHFNLIGDKSYIKEENSNFVLEYMSQKFGEKFLILDPSNSVSIFLDFATLISLSYYFLMIPLHFTYKSFAVNSIKVELDSIFFCVLVFDIVRTFNTAIYLKGKLVYLRWRIAVQYLKQDFFLDFISLIPAFILIMDIYKFNYEYFLILFYLKIKNFKGIITKLEQLLLTNRKFHHGLCLLKLIIWIIFITHSFACVWNSVGLIGDKYFEKTWLKDNNLEHSDSIEQYLFSYYFVCVTMNTVGFGDITPTNKLEVSFCVVFIFLACGIFAYSINSIGIILTDISKQQDEYRKDLNTMNDFMKKKKISFDLRMRIRKYLEYIKKENKLHEDKETDKTIDKLSDSLREELLLEANGSILKRINFFSLNFSEETLRKTMMIMKEKKFTPGDVIFEKGDLQETKLYIIKTGEVELLFGNSNNLKTVQSCKKGDTFGEFAFFSGKEQKFSARSLDFTTTFAIDKNEFLSIINKVNRDFEKFNEIKEKLILYNDPSPLHSRCFSCRRPNHKLEKCPIIHYCPKEQIIIDKFLFNEFQEREYYQRKRREKIHNSFYSKIRNIQTAKRLQEDLKKSTFFFENESESEKEEDEKEEVNEANDSLTIFDDPVILYY